MTFGYGLTQTFYEKQGRKLAETLEVGVEWILQGTTSRRDYPVDERLVNWLWEHEDGRREIWERMCGNHSVMGRGSNPPLSTRPVNFVAILFCAYTASCRGSRPGVKNYEVVKTPEQEVGIT